jgi:hypothetical protein
MKAITVRLKESELKFLREVKEAGFASIAEVIKCAALSFVASAPKNTNGKAA